MSTFDPDDGFEALLRDSMHDQADSVLPAGDGLSRIQQRVAVRRARLRWLRPAAALGSAAVLAVIGVGAYAAVNGNGGTDRVETPPLTQTPGSPSPSVTSSPSPTTAPAAVTGFPKRAIFPFVNAAEERSWEQQADGGHMPWVADPKGVATFWVANYLQLPSIDTFVRQTSFTSSRVDVVLGRNQSDAGSQRQVEVTTVHLVKYGKAWIVVGASDGSGLLRISSPKAGATVSSPVEASGPGGGVHRAATVEVRDAATPTKYGEGQAGSFGSNVGWSTSVSFSTPSRSVGVLVVIEKSDADGLPLRVTAEQVRFGTSSVSAGPAYFYGIKNGRVTKFAARNGAAIDYLTDPQPGGGASDPQLVGSDVYFLRANGPCSVALHNVSTLPSDNTQPEVAVASPDDGYAITGFATDGTAVSFFEQACDSSRSPQAKLVSTDGSGGRHVVTFDGLPPTIVADPSLEPAGGQRYLDAIVDSGHTSSLVRYTPMSGSSPVPSRRACPGYDVNNGRPWALETDASGTIWFATQTGSSMQVVKCVTGGNTAVVAFTVPGNRQPADVDVSSDGSVLLTDINGDIWRWDGSGDATELTKHSVPLTHVTW
ncbi:MAG TPA: Gmad2 immunoglobulin-like domain-containing protein [Mycobacteriales bacterium]|nr:Gmad2 immunoglobulin-like domain-containing protein [Mycobacteriales bacterium]